MKSKTFGTGIAALVATMMITGCNGNTTYGDFDGVPLAELDTSGTPPRGVSIGGVDTLVVTRGEAFQIDVEGDDEARDLVRFALEGGMLKVGRANGSSRDTATIRVTLPEVTSAAVGGSADLEIDYMAGDATIAVGGSGDARIGEIDAASLKVSVGGSGDLEARGKADSIDLSVGGSGTADLKNLSVTRASVAIGGSGDAKLSSNGEVTGAVGGSGGLEISGGADCRVKTSGSASVDC